MEAATDNVLLVLREILRDEATQINDSIISGGCKDYAEYKHKTGILIGLGIAEREILDLNRRLEES